MREGVIPPPEPALVARFRRDVTALAGADPGVLGLAVSGGADSLAMLLLAHAGFAGSVSVATVDHGLRAEAAGEAAFVADICRALAVPHAILTLDRCEAEQLRGSGNVQARARRWRYAMLRRWGTETGLRWLLTAHHADDQAETVLMRLNRGAGVDGLTGIRPRLAYPRAGGAAWSDVGDPVWTIVRPLLGFRKAELERVCRSAGLIPVADPSNDDARYDRTAARRLLGGQDWLAPGRIGASARHLGEAADALHWAGEQEKARRLVQGDGGPDRFVYDLEGLPHELLRRIARDAIESVRAMADPGRSQSALRGDELDRLIGRVEAGVASTLGGVLVRRTGRLWAFNHAPPRRGH